MADDDDDDDPAAAPDAPQRIDKWLWFARVAKTRTLAATLVQGGKVRINRVKVVKPSHGCKSGDVVTVSAGGNIRVLKVLQSGVRRGPAAEAQGLYEDLTPKDVQPPPRPDGGDAGGRPTKKGRRQIARFRGTR